MNSNSKVTLLAGLCSIAALSYSPQTFAASNLNEPAAVQQTKKITGIISDNQGPVIGATVKVKGTNTAAVTDLDGRFSLNVAQGATLEVSYVGYLTKSFKVGNASTYNITLEEDNNNIDEVVVVGYGTMKKSDISGATVSLGEKAIRESPVTNVNEVFQGRIAGVQTISTSGAPGSAVSVSVRGIASINAGTEPLYVVDGVIWESQGQSGADYGLADKLGNGSHSTVSPLSLINPQDIVNIETLKDASSCAIYGARGANGVVLITTKHGKSGDAKFTYAGQLSVQRQNKRIDMMNLREFGEYYNSLAQQGEISKPDKMYSDPSILGKGTNWQDAVLQTAIMHNHSLTAEGGTDKVTYYVSGNFMNQEGTVIGSEFKRYSLRTNLTAQLKKWMKIGVDANYSNTSENLKLADSNEGLIYYSLSTPPDIQIYNIDGGYSSVSKEGFSNPNPIAMAMQNEILLKRQALTGSVYSDITFIPGLTLHTQLGFNIGASKGDTYQPKIALGTWHRDNNEAHEQKNSSKYWSLNNYLTYDKQFGKHHGTIMLGQECSENSWDYVSLTTTGLPLDIIHNANLGGEPKVGQGFGSGSSASFFTRLSYGYDERFDGTFTFRRDASSNFGPNNRWGTFPSFATGWRFTNEKFIRNTSVSKWLTNGKLRIGWGQNGNSAIPGFRWGSAMSVMESYWGQSFRPQNIKNRDIKWEKQETTNIGLDLGFLNNRINVTMDWYNKISSDMLMELSLPSIMGTSGNGSSKLDAPWGNYGKIKNTGFEFDFKAIPVQTKDWSWDFDINLTTNKNKLVSLDGGPSLPGYGQWTDQVSICKEGEPLMSFYGYQVEGVYKDFNDILNSPVNTLQRMNPITTDADGKKHWNTDPSKYSRSNTTFVGDLKFKDVNGDGIIDENDKTTIGSPFPDFTFGFNNNIRYKNFELNFFIYGSVGNKIGNYTEMLLTHMNSAWSNQMKVVNDRAILVPTNGQYTDGWYDDVTNVSVKNSSTCIPRASINDPNDNDVWSDRYIHDGSYVRLKNISLAYNFNKSLINKLKLTNLRVSVNATNLVTITSYKGYDPEIGMSTQSAHVMGLDNGRYPSPTSFTFSVNASF